MLRQCTPICRTLGNTSFVIPPRRDGAIRRASSWSEENEIRKWYQHFQPGNIPKELSRVTSDKSKVTVEYSLGSFIGQMPQAVQQKIRQSMYVDGLKTHNAVLKASSSIKGSNAHREQDARERLMFVVHRAARSLISGKEETFNALQPGLKTKDYNAELALEKKFQKERRQAVDEKVLKKGTERAMARAFDKAQRGSRKRDIHKAKRSSSKTDFQRRTIGLSQ